MGSFLPIGLPRAGFLENVPLTRLLLAQWDPVKTQSRSSVEDSQAVDLVYLALLLA
jgi:hypothetical protein